MSEGKDAGNSKRDQSVLTCQSSSGCRSDDFTKARLLAMEWRVQDRPCRHVLRLKLFCFLFSCFWLYCLRMHNGDDLKKKKTTVLLTCTCTLPIYTQTQTLENQSTLFTSLKKKRYKAVYHSSSLLSFFFLRFI